MDVWTNVQTYESIDVGSMDAGSCTWHELGGAIADEGGNLGFAGYSNTEQSCKQKCDDTAGCLSASFSTDDGQCWKKDKQVQSGDAINTGNTGAFKTLYKTCSSALFVHAGRCNGAHKYLGSPFTKEQCVEDTLASNSCLIQDGNTFAYMNYQSSNGGKCSCCTYLITNPAAISYADPDDYNMYKVTPGTFRASKADE